MTSEPGERPVPGPDENQNPGGIPGHPYQGPERSHWPAQAPPLPPPYWPGYSEPSGAWAYGQPPASPPGPGGWPWPGGANPGGRRRGPRVGLLVAGGLAALLVAGMTGGFIG